MRLQCRRYHDRALGRTAHLENCAGFEFTCVNVLQERWRAPLARAQDFRQSAAVLEHILYDTSREPRSARARAVPS